MEKIKEHDSGTPAHDNTGYIIHQINPPDTELEDKRKTNVVFCKNVYPSTTKELKIYSDLCGRFPNNSSRGNKYIDFSYFYDCNAILPTAINNRSDK